MTSRSRRGCGAIVLTALVLLLAGCDDESAADKQTRQNLNDAAHQMAMGSENAASAMKLLDDAAQNAGASAGVRTSARAARAQAFLDAARDAVHKIDADELKLARIEWEITQLAIQIRTSSTAVAGQKQFDPKAARDAIAGKIAEAQGGPDKAAWFTQGSAVLPTLAAVKQDLAKLEADLAARQDKIKALAEQAREVLDDIDKLLAQSEKQTGADAEASFKQLAELHKQAGDAGTQTDDLQHEVQRIQAKIAIAQGQQTAVSEVIAQLQGQSAALEKAWKDMDSQMAAHQKLSTEILGTGGAPPGDSTGGSINQKAAELNALVASINTQRTDAMVNAGNAKEDFAKANQAATEYSNNLQKQIRDPANSSRAEEKKAWNEAAAAMEPMQFRLSQATALRMIGDLSASSASSLAARMSLRSTVEAALAPGSLRMPPEITDGDMDTQRQDALKAADAAYKEADELLATIVEGQAPQQLQNSAKIAKALTLYNWALVARQQGNPQVASARITEATERRNSAAENNASIPIMPAELGAIPKPAPPPAEGTPAPTTEPATAPAGA